MKKTYIVKLKAKERTYLKELISRGTEKARKLTRCRILLLANEEKTDTEITKALNIVMATVFQTRRRYAKEGLEAAINERPRSGQPLKFNGKQLAKITAIACSTPPEGRSRWTLRLLANKAVELDIVDNISYTNIRNILKKMNLSLI